MDATEEELRAVPGIGPIVANSIAEHFRNQGNRAIVHELAEVGVRLEEEIPDEPQGPQPFEGMRFVVTGRLEGFTRTDAESFIKDRGGAVAGSVSKKTDYVVVGEDAGSKLDDANRLGVRTITEDDLRALAEGRLV
jgi:DNA ligase (NAD+)